jgi:hypothetical protein
LSLSNLNAGDSYNLLVYVGSLGYYGIVSDVAVNLGSQTFYLNTDDNNPYANPVPIVGLTGYTQATATDPGSAVTADYVEFNGIPGSTLAGESVTVTGAGSGISGFQLVDNAVPEPGTIWSAALGLIGLVGFQIRRSRKS